MPFYNDIRSELKSRRIKFDVPHTYTSMAFMKQMRENDQSRKIYDVDPYVEVYRVRDDVYALFTENCDGMADVWMYLINGSSSAFLIDTGYGLGDTKALIDTITDGKPLIVVNTHNHCDHAYGNCRFEKVYCHEYLVPYLESQNEHQWDYLFDENGNNIWLDFDRRDLPVFKKFEIVGVPDGYAWDLGDGHEVEMIFQGGHAAGHVAYLDKKNRILFPGDNVCSDTSHAGGIGGAYWGMDGPYSEATLLKNYKERVRVLVNRMDEYDYIFPQHFMLDIRASAMQNVLETLEAIDADPTCYDYKQETPRGTLYFKYIRGFTHMSYTSSEPL